MSPYYDQPGLRQRGPEDVAGVLVLLACAVLAFAWYVAVSRLHLRNQQCLEIFLYVAWGMIFFRTKSVFLAYGRPSIIFCE